MRKWFPLLVLSIIIYNVLIFGGGLFFNATAQTILDRSVRIPMFLGDNWVFRAGDGLVLISLCLLFFKVLKSTRTSPVEIFNHALSMLVYIVALVEFLALRGLSTTTYFFIVGMAFIDVVTGFTISIVAAKHDLVAAHGILGNN